MDRERWLQVEELLDELLDLVPDERVDRLNRAAEADPELARQAEKLLQQMQADGEDLFNAAVFQSLPEIVAGAAEESVRDRSGTVLGPYRLVRVLGRGGMGVVYLAERADEEYEKQVAIKLMPRGLESDEAERRFRLERQVLARLEHPHIARLLDGGVTDEGYPYLVMELVEGEPIDVWCDQRGLDLEQRLHLFLDVSGAVQFAHQNLVIHRDLKPGNILVTADGVPKLLDFGVAKLAEEDAEAPDLTLYQPRTTAYASPEQLANRPVSTTSDVFSLGVVLYRLLTGVLPREAATGDPTTDGDSTTNRQRPAPLASRAVSTASENPVPWARQLTGDLDNILAKALAEASEERYASAQELADDLRHHLDGQPVIAREATAGYRLQKFISRHRVGFFASLAAVVVLVAALITALWQADRARAEADRARRVAALMTGLFTDADPWAPTSGQVTVPDLLDRGVERVRSELAGEADLQSELLDVLGKAYDGHGDQEKGIPLLEEVYRERREHLGEDHPRTFESMRTLGYALLNDGRWEEAAPLIEQAAAFAEQQVDPQDPELIDYLFALGLLRKAEADYGAQEVIFRRIVDLLRGQSAEPTSTLALALGELSVALDFQGRDPESLEVQRKALAMSEGTMGEAHPYSATLRNNLALRLSEAGDKDQAEIYLRKTLELYKARPGIHERELIAPLSNLGSMLMGAGDFAGARPYVERAAEIARRTNPRENYTRIGAEINLASIQREAGRLQEAESMFRAALKRFEQQLGPQHQGTARVQALLGGTLAWMGRREEAEDLLRTGLAIQRDPDTDPMSPDQTLLSLGRVLVDTGTLDEAEILLQEALELRQGVYPATAWQVAEVQLELAALAGTRGQSRRRTRRDFLPRSRGSPAGGQYPTGPGAGPPGSSPLRRVPSGGASGRIAYLVVQELTQQRRCIVRSTTSTITTMILAAASVACSPQATVEQDSNAETAPPVVEVMVREYSMALPSTIESGWTTFKLRNEGKQEHFAWIYRLPDGLSWERYVEEGDGTFDLIYAAYYRGDLTRTEAIQKMGAELPDFFQNGVVPSGGPAITEAGETSLTTVHLDPGTYGIECYVKMPDGEWHTNMGMQRELTVTAEANGAEPPQADVEMTLSEYDITLSDALEAGKHTIAVHVVDSPEVGLKYDVSLFRYADESELEEIVAWMDWWDVAQFRAPAPGYSLGGMENMAAGKTGYITVDLEPGNYAWVSEGYANRGMVETFVVR